MAKREKAPALIRKGPSYLYRAQWTEQGVKQRAAWVVGRVCEPIAIAERNAKVCRSMVRAGRAHEVPAFLAGKLDPGPSLATTPGHDVSVKELAEELFEVEERDNARRAKEVRSMFRLYLDKQIGRLPLAAVTPSIVRERVFEPMADRGLAPATLNNARNAARKVFNYALEKQLVQRNPVDDIYRMPRAERDNRPFVLPTDAEIATLVHYLYSRPPDEHIKGVGALELATLVVASRCIGGQRTSDLHAWRWSDIRWDEKVATVRRPKTSRFDGELTHATIKADHQLEEDELEAMRRWWVHCGEPVPRLEGRDKFDPLVFPTRTGDRAGASKRGTYYAAPLRTAMRRALGVEVPRTETRTTERKYPNGKTRKLTFETTVWEEARKPNDRERELLEGTDEFRPLVMHSMRRAYATALAVAGMSTLQLKLAGGWRTTATVERYTLAAQREQVKTSGTKPNLRLVS